MTVKTLLWTIAAFVSTGAAISFAQSTRPPGTVVADSFYATPTICAGSEKPAGVDRKGNAVGCSAAGVPSSAAQNSVLAGPASGGAGASGFRALQDVDIPALPASKIGSGVLGVARLGTGTPSGATSLWGDGAWRAMALADLPACPTTTAGQVLYRWNGTAIICGGVDGGDVTSGTVAAARIADLATSKITSGTFVLSDGRLPITGGGTILPTTNGLTSSRAAIVDAAGRLASATGTATDCVRVDGTSGACGSGGASPLLSFAGAVITVSPGGITLNSVRTEHSSMTVTVTAGAGTVYIGRDLASGLVTAGVVGTPTLTATCGAGITCETGVSAMPTDWLPIGTCTVVAAAVTACTANPILQAQPVEAGAGLTETTLASGVKRISLDATFRREIPLTSGSGYGPGIAAIGAGGYTAPVVALLGGGEFNPWYAMRCLDAQLCGWVFTSTLPGSYVANTTITVTHAFFSGATGAMRMRTAITCARTGDLTGAAATPTSSVLSTVAIAAEGRTVFSHTHVAPACQPHDVIHLHFSRLGADAADTSTGSIWSINGVMSY